MRLQHFNRWKAAIIIITAITISSVVFLISFFDHESEKEKKLIQDVSRLHPVHVNKVVPGKEEAGLRQALAYAREHDLKVSIAGARHSQGGHAYYKDSVWLDMSSFDKILHLNKEDMTITVQSGVTWDDIQEYINPYSLSVKVMQSSNIFTVGGSLSSNVHGRDPRYGPIIETVQSFRLLLADGSIIHVSREKNEELFDLVIGGYGLFGVILDVTIELTKNEIYVSETEKINYKQYAAYVKKNITYNEDVGLHFARLSVAPNSLLNEMYMTTYKKLSEESPRYPSKNEYESINQLQLEKHTRRDKFLLGLSRKYDWGKSLTWYLQQMLYAEEEEGEVITRNNAMRPPVKFLEYESSEDTDILQEYFIPMNQFAAFVDELRKIVQNEDLNLLNVTVRYTPAHHEGYLRYSKQDTLALVLFFNQSMSEQGINHMKQATQKIVDTALALDGTYYLTYQLYPSKEQILQAYPMLPSFFEKKLIYDPNEIFMNHFYEKYR